MGGGVAPDVVSYNSVINACAKAGKADRAERWLAKAIEGGVAPNVVSYTAVIDACAKAGKAERAEHWLAQARRSGIILNVVSYTAAMKGCIRAKPKLPKIAEQLFRQMLSDRIAPDNYLLRQLKSIVGAQRFELLCTQLRVTSEDVEQDSKQLK